MITKNELNAHRHSFRPLFEPDLTPENTYILDLSGENKSLANHPADNFSRMEALLKAEIEAKQAIYAYGGYLEDRAVYRRSDLFAGEGGNTRSIHLGIDVWAPEKTAVHLPFEGIVHSFQNNDTFGDYGPTIIMEHQINRKTFFTLYGHLSLDSLEELKIGLILKAGRPFCHLGSPSENGNWPAHLHFQIITDIQSKYGDFPGVAFRDETDIYRSICPDPAVFFTRLFPIIQ